MAKYSRLTYQPFHISLKIVKIHFQKQLHVPILKYTAVLKLLNAPHSRQVELPEIKSSFFGGVKQDEEQNSLL